MDSNIIEFTRDLSTKTYESRKEYDKHFVTLRKKYKLCPKKTDIRKCIPLIDKTKITESFMKYSVRKIGKSTSGVTVITVLTSPFPEYTKDDKKVKQSFSCGKDCAYCPNEPEVTISLQVISIDKDKVMVQTNENLQLIRVINYVIYNETKIDIKDSLEFKDHTFTIIMDNPPFQIGDMITGVKIAQPRSYISSEPAVLRANRNQFDCCKQMWDRAVTLQNMGHPVDKVEVIILGGTWDHYPLEYREEFIRDIYYSMNVFCKDKVEKRSLEEEIELNEKADTRIIGVTTETRPDCITLKAIKQLRRMNITRVQIGVQHINNGVLRFIKRDCYLQDTINSNYLLKQNGYKVDMHLMPDLPGSSYQKDLEMFQKIFSHKVRTVVRNHYKYELEYPELQADQLKIYPCSTTPHTEIHKWYKEGLYVPYSEDKETLIKLLIYVKSNVFPWIRLNRIIRDIPHTWIEGGNKDVSLRQYLLSQMKEQKRQCRCIRCREVKDKDYDINLAELFIREYNGVDATEYFISFESPDQDVLYGFLRLRINHTDANLIDKDLYGSAFIRELHVYGSLSKHGEEGNNVQHKGMGKKLIQKAEEIVCRHNLWKIHIISGVGVREYYMKQGYNLNKETQFLVKKLHEHIIYDPCFCLLIFFTLMTFVMIAYEIHFTYFKI